MLMKTPIRMSVRLRCLTPGIPTTIWDQLRRPRGAFFVELSNPWAASPAATADVHQLSDQNNGLGVDEGIPLNRMDQQSGSSPVWRMMVYRNATMHRDPDDPDPLVRPDDLDRSIYFITRDPEMITRPGSGLQWDDDGVAFHQDTGVGTRAGLVRPLGNVVIGSGESAGNQTFEAPLGSMDDGAPAEVKVILRPGGSTPVALVNNGRLTVTAASNSDSMVLNAPATIDGF